MFDLRLGQVAEWVRGGGYSSVALQLPEGLKARAAEAVDFLSSSTGAEFTILGDPCYGACDLCAGYRGFADALVHFGHSPIPSQGDDPDVMYVEAFSDADVAGSVLAIAGGLPGRVGLLATVQYVNCIPQAARALESAGKEVRVGRGDARTLYPGQVLGCNCSAAEAVADEVDCFLFLGEGDFHPLAAAFGAGREVKVLNPLTGELRSVDGVRDRILRQRFAAIQRASAAESFLVVVCGKVGQCRPALADSVVAMLRAAGRRAYRARMEELSPENLAPYRVDAYVSTACPRIAMDDASRYPKPMLTPPEAEVAVGKRAWEDYAFDAIRPRTAMCQTRRPRPAAHAVRIEV